MEPRISIITLGVADLQRSTAFYREGLKLPERKEGSDNITFFETSGTWLALYRRDPLAEDAQVPSEGSGFRAFTLAHNVGSPEEVDQLLEDAESAGAYLIKAAQETFWGGYSGYFADPDGFLWEITWNPHFSVQ